MDKTSNSLLRPALTVSFLPLLPPILSRLAFLDRHLEDKKQFLESGALKQYLQSLAADRPLLGLALAFVLFLIGSVYLSVYLIKKKVAHAILVPICAGVSFVIGCILIWLFWFH